MEHTQPFIDKQGTAEKIKYHMVKKGLKPADIQNYLGLSCVQSVYRWLEGVNIPTIDNLYALSQLFSVRMDDLIAGNRIPNEKLPVNNMYAYMMAYYKAFYHQWGGKMIRRGLCAE